MQMDIKVIGSIKEYLKMFSGPDDFNLWYVKNKDDVDKLTTHKLNKMYHIDGYRITKIKGILCLKKDEKNPVNENKSETDPKNPDGHARSGSDRLRSWTESELAHENDYQNELENITNQIEQLKSDIIAIKTTINEIVKAINGE